MFCPKDMKPCCDSICRGSGICLLTGDELIPQCSRCGELADEDHLCDDDLDYIDYDDEF